MFFNSCVTLSPAMHIYYKISDSRHERDNNKHDSVNSSHSSAFYTLACSEHTSRLYCQCLNICSTLCDNFFKLCKCICTTSSEQIFISGTLALCTSLPWDLQTTTWPFHIWAIARYQENSVQCIIVTTKVSKDLWVVLYFVLWRENSTLRESVSLFSL